MSISRRRRDTHPGRFNFRRNFTRRLLLEQMEDRRLLAIDLAGVADWLEQGAQPFTMGSSVAAPNNPAGGAVEDLAIDPNDPSHMFAATVNGGIWRTRDGNRPFNGLDDDGVNGVDDALEQPSWVATSDQHTSLGINGIAFDPLDATGNTVFAGTGSASSLSNTGGLPIGIMKTTNDGANWFVYPLNPAGAEPQVREVVPTTYTTADDPTVTSQVVLVGTLNGVFRSIDAGETYTNVSNTDPILPTGAVTDFVADPNNEAVFYAGIAGSGVFRTADAGATWAAVNNATLSTNGALGTSTAVMLTAHAGGGTTRVYAMISYDDDGAGASEVPTIFTTTDGGTNWAQLAATPAGMASGNGDLYNDMASDQIIVDPANQLIVYIAKGYGGSPHMFRYNPVGAGSWVQIENSGNVSNTRPHVDHRDLQFTNSGGNDVLINANDGGLYFLVDPQTPDAWVGLHGLGATGIGAMEFTNVTLDSNWGELFGGAQDNGTSSQTGVGTRIWQGFRGSDGGDVQATDINDTPGGNSFRFSATQPPNAPNQNQSPISRHEFDATGELSATNLFPVAGLTGFTPRFVAQFELNVIDADRLVIGGGIGNGGTSPLYELTNARTATGPGDATWVAVAGITTAVNDNFDAAFVAGGRRNGVDNAEFLVVASGNTVFLRSTAGAVAATTTAFPGQTIQAIAVDPDDWQHIFVADSDQVWETTNAGMGWTEITENLQEINSRLQSLAYVPTPEGDVILVGGNLGVSRLPVGSPGAPWTRLGANLPNALVNDLEYHADDDILIAGTFGRGAWTVDDASTVVNEAPVLNICGDEDQVNQDDVIRLVRNMANPLMLDVYLNSVAPVFSVALAVLQQINVFGVGGNDRLTVDSSYGLLNVPSGIRYNGDGTCPAAQPGFGYDRGFDTLVLDQAEDEGDTQTSHTYSVGPARDSGTSVIVGPSGTQSIFFEELEPVIDLVPADDLFINATAEPNAINYVAGSNVFRGLITIDSYETIEFINKASFTINAGLGDDSVILDNALTPMDLALIVVNAGGGNDTVVNRGAAAIPQRLNGDAGDDFIVGGPTTNNISGGDGFDTIGVLGTPGNNVIDVRQVNGTTLTSIIDGNTRTDTFGTVEAFRVVAGLGDDIIRVAHSDTLVATPDSSRPFEVLGGGPSASDRLAVRDDGIGDTVVYRKGADNRSGSVSVGPLAPVSFEQIEFLDVTPLNSITGGTGTDGNGRLVVFKPDLFETNNSRTTAIHLGAGATISVDPVIDPGAFVPLDLPGDQDWFEFIAAETGVLDFQLFFEQIGTLSNGRAGLPGNGNLSIEAYDSSGDLIGSSTTAGDNERLTIGAVRNERYFLSVFGAAANAVNVYNLTAVNVPAPVPFQVDLQASADSGRSDTDNITNDTTTTFDVYLDDDRLEAFNNLDLAPDDDYFVELYNNGVLLGVATFQGPDPGVGDNSRWEFTLDPGDLQEGHNNFITAAVRIRDQANPRAIGRGVFSPPLQVTLDTIAPSGTARLFPDSDSGIWGFDQTMSDLITSDMTPLLYGAAEANALVRVALDRDLILNPTGTPDGTAVAIPLDGDEAFLPPPEFDGNYFLQTILSLSDGEHSLEVQFQDVAGNTSPVDADATLVIFVDTAGPKITNVTRGDVSTDNVHSDDFVTSLFEPKPSDTGPDPLVHSIVVHFSDLPDRTDEFADYHALFLALAEEEGNYQVKGDHNGNIAIVDVIVSFTTIPNDGLPETATVELVFDRPLPDDRYTVWVSDNLSDAAGNPLDGESGALGPFDGNNVDATTPPIFPTGDGAHGGDFWGRFTIDSRPEIGTFALGSVYIDINGNTVFDPEGQDRDYTNRDIAFLFGFRDDKIFAGNFNEAVGGVNTGYDKLGGYGTAGAGSAWRWRLDFNHDGVVDYDKPSGVNTQGDPVAGNFSAAHPGDEIGLFNAGKWWLDAGGDNNIGGPGDIALQGGNMKGQPIVGDFDGDGLDDLGTWDPGNAGTQFDGVFSFDFANNGLTGNAQATIQFDVPGVFQRAIAADINEDGIDDLGLFVTRREGVPPAESAEWFFLVSNVSLKATGTVLALNHQFTPVPFGNDVYMQFGDEAALPVVGNFDPPTSSTAFLNDLDHNPINAMDVNNDGFVSPLDVLVVINALNARVNNKAFDTGFGGAPFLDVNADHFVSPLDVLVVINQLNRRSETSPSAGGEGEAADAYFSGLGSDADISGDKALGSLLASDMEDQLRKRKWSWAKI